MCCSHRKPRALPLCQSPQRARPGSPDKTYLNSGLNVFRQSRRILALTLNGHGCISASRRRLQWVLGSDAASSWQRFGSAWLRVHDMIYLETDGTSTRQDRSMLDGGLSLIDSLALRTAARDDYRVRNSPHRAASRRDGLRRKTQPHDRKLNEAEHARINTGCYTLYHRCCSVRIIRFGKIREF